MGQMASENMSTNLPSPHPDPFTRLCTPHVFCGPQVSSDTGQAGNDSDESQGATAVSGCNHDDIPWHLSLHAFLDYKWERRVLAANAPVHATQGWDLLWAWPTTRHCGSCPSILLLESKMLLVQERTWTVRISFSQESLQPPTPTPCAVSHGEKRQPLGEFPAWANFCAGVSSSWGFT